MKLADWMYENGWTPAELQRELGVKSGSTIGRYYRDEQIPAPAVMERINKITGGRVTRDDFLDPTPARCSVLITLPNGKAKRIYPWNKNDRLWNAVVEATKKEPRAEDGEVWQIRRTLGIFGKAARPLGRGRYLLNGRVVDDRRFVAMANRRRIQWGQDPIPYPGVKGGSVIDER